MKVFPIYFQSPKKSEVNPLLTCSGSASTFSKPVSLPCIIPTQRDPSQTSPETSYHHSLSPIPCEPHSMTSSPCGGAYAPIGRTQPGNPSPVRMISSEKQESAPSTRRFAQRHNQGRGKTISLICVKSLVEDFSTRGAFGDSGCPG
jgi:hypothetical protein